MRIELESESAVSDSEYYGAGCCNQAKIEQGATNSSPESTGHLESSGCSQSRLSYMHPFSNLCTPSVLPVMTPFVPLRKFSLVTFMFMKFQTNTVYLRKLGMNIDYFQEKKKFEFSRIVRTDSLFHSEQHSDVTSINFKET